MLIPLQAEPAEDFLVRATATISDQGTQVYVDTSLAMWLTVIGPASRAAFIDWTTAFPGRVHVPAWTIQEYYRHHRAKTLKTEINEQCIAVSTAAADFRKAMRLPADGPLLPAEPQGAFLARIDRVRDELAALTAAAKAWRYDEASHEVISWMNGHALDQSEVFERFANLKQTGGARYAHDVPPGYEDRRKGLNRYGDLLFWQDVVADARRREATRVVVLTRDRKEDWYGSAPEPEVGPALRRLRSRWEPVPSPHPMLAFEMRTAAGCELLLLDELYLGALLWRADKARFGRFAAVALGMSADRLSAELAPPPPVRVRAAARLREDRITLLQALALVRGALEGAPDADQAAMLTALQGEAPAAEDALRDLTADWAGRQEGAALASLSRRVFDLADAAQPFATQAAKLLLDAVDQMDALHASAIVGGMLAGAYYDGAAPRNRPVGELLQDVYGWAADPGCERTLKALANRLRSQQSPAVVLPDGAASRLEARLEASDAVATVPPTLGQFYLGAQAVLTDQAVGVETRLRDVMAGREEATVAEIVEAVARHYGVPLVPLSIVGSADGETWMVGETTGLERFGPLSQPARGNATASDAQAGIAEPPTDIAAEPVQADHVEAHEQPAEEDEFEDEEDDEGGEE